MYATPRQMAILKIVKSRGSCRIVELANMLGVSDETIRRNIKPLVGSGTMRRVHGGVVVPRRIGEAPIERRMMEHAEEKERIATAIAARIEDGDSLILDTGSTAVHVAIALMERANLFVITNSSKVASVLASEKSNRVFLAGGEMSEHDLGTYGQDTIAFVSRFQVKYAVLSVAAMHMDKGFMVYFKHEADFQLAAMAHADRCIVGMDSTKFGATSPVRLCDLTGVDTLVSDAAPDAETQRRLAIAKVELVVADSGKRPAGSSRATGGAKANVKRVADKRPTT